MYIMKHTAKLYEFYGSHITYRCNNMHPIDMCYCLLVLVNVERLCVFVCVNHHHMCTNFKIDCCYSSFFFFFYFVFVSRLSSFSILLKHERFYLFPYEMFLFVPVCMHVMYMWVFCVSACALHACECMSSQQKELNVCWLAWFVRSLIHSQKNSNEFFINKDNTHCTYTFNNKTELRLRNITNTLTLVTSCIIIHTQLQSWCWCRIYTFI